jgi:hypothetical protein
MKIYIPYKRSEYHIPPAFYQSKGITYFGSAGIWNEVPEETDFEDIVYKLEDESLEDFLWDFFE